MVYSRRLAEDVAKEFVQQCYSQKGEPVVGFFKSGIKEGFCIPAYSLGEAQAITKSFEEMFVEAIKRYEFLRG